MMYLLINEAGRVAATNAKTNDLNKIDDHWEIFILTSSKSAREICQLANHNTLGHNCCVAEESGIVLWEWNITGKWSSPKDL